MRATIKTPGDLAFALRAAREASGLTQATMAEELMVDQPTVSRMENDMRRPTLAVERLLGHLRASGATITIEWTPDAAGR